MAVRSYLQAPESQVVCQGHQRGVEVRSYATLMGTSEVTSQPKGWGGEKLCDFDGDF